jgi:hypothetical protein
MDRWCIGSGSESELEYVHVNRRTCVPFASSDDYLLDE